MGLRRSKTAHDILSYVHENPHAADTVEGIAKWWLRDQYLLTEVRQVLAQLVSEGLMIKVEGNNLQPIYKLNRKG